VINVSYDPWISNATVDACRGTFNLNPPRISTRWLSLDNAHCHDLPANVPPRVLRVDWD
jgi:hypothetical protein